MMDIHNTTEWPEERLLRYGPDITKAMRKLAERFPREVTVQHLYEEIVSGKKTLWLILDDEKFVSFVVTEIHINNATGLKTIVVPSMAGEDGPTSVPLIAKLEEWGKARGCDQSLVYGRYGWKRPLADEGYKMDMVAFRKAL